VETARDIPAHKFNRAEKRYDLICGKENVKYRESGGFSNMDDKSCDGTRSRDYQSCCLNLSMSYTAQGAWYSPVWMGRQAAHNKLNYLEN